jgi:hypothetical protein
MAVAVRTPVVHAVITKALSVNSKTRYTTSQLKGKLMVKPSSVSVMLSINELLSSFFLVLFLILFSIHPFPISEPLGFADLSRALL